MPAYFSGDVGDICHLHSDGWRIGCREGFHSNVAAKYTALSDEHAAYACQLSHHGQAFM